MEKFVLKNQLKELVDGRAVTAALFYTFNFDPAFFENYVMPLLLPGQDFNDNAIHNHILWRKCLKQKIVPPVTVYCDHYAKDNTAAPRLGYDIRCIRLNGNSRHDLVNFHPKECWLLLADGTLLHINGSANLTPSGWCENIECCAVTRLPRKSHPNTVTLNTRQRVIQAICGLSGFSKLTDAEDRIFNFLKYTEETDNYFSSLEQAFGERLEGLAHGSEMIEVVSPYMYGEALLIEQLQKRGFRDIRCLIPSLRSNEVLLSKDIFLSMKEKGVTWCYWLDKELGNEPRDLHAKIYRLHSERRAVTVTGSINFTGPAWGKCLTGTNNQANVESGFVHHDKILAKLLSPAPHLDIDQLTFIAKDDPETTETTGWAARSAPLLYFTLDWKTRTLSYSGKTDKKQRVNFKNILFQQELSAAHKRFVLSGDDIKVLTQNALIELQDLTAAGETYYYYPRQTGIECRPLPFKLTPEAILSFWLEEDAGKQAEMAEQIAIQITGEDGTVNGDDYQSPSLLNEMARHFTALINLERRLFARRYPSRQEQFQAMRYYLLAENLDTVPFYLKGIADLAEKQSMTKTFHWMVLQLVCVRLYDQALSWPFKGEVRGSWPAFRKSATTNLAAVRKEAAVCGKAVNGLAEKADWFIAQIKEQYDR